MKNIVALVLTDEQIEKLALPEAGPILTARVAVFDDKALKTREVMEIFGRELGLALHRGAIRNGW